MTKGQTTVVFLGAVVLCLLSGLVGASIAGKFDISWGSEFNVDFGQSISIILSALGAILTALALLFAVLAIVGWATFSQQVDRNVRSYIEKDFDSRGPLFKAVVKDLKPKLKEDLLPALEREMFRGTEAQEDEIEQLDSAIGDEPEHD